MSDPVVPIASPKHEVASDENHLEAGIALCLSGGGYRAMVFHCGVLLRLNDANYLSQLKRISSVSGGSIMAGMLGLKWKTLKFSNGAATNLSAEVIEPIFRLASRTIDKWSVLGGMLLPGTVSDKIAEAYDKHLFAGATLQDLPADGDGPRFVINATNVQSGAIWRFSRPYMGDYLVGRVMAPTIRLATAVAASSAFPPVLSPLDLELSHSDFQPDSGCPLQRPPFTTDVVLTDGGVYDNLGLEPIWKRYRTILISDAGGKLAAEPEAKHDWGRHVYRVLELVDNQVRSLRKRDAIASFVDQKDDHDGTYWGIRTDIADYKLSNALPAPFEATMQLANTPTRLERMDEQLQHRLANWGYAVCDAALRRHLDPKLSVPAGFPFPGGVQ
ncbi:MAG: patatin-like phospholipase family protein [Candidatus Sumerlaeaceae bacterium]